jgi:hypothetical protein
MFVTLITYLTAWIVVGLGMGAGLYDAAFATLGQISGTGLAGAGYFCNESRGRPGGQVANGCPAIHRAQTALRNGWNRANSSRCGEGR